MASSHLRSRREARYPLEIEIEISCAGADGQIFHERTRTRNVSEWGCAFASSREFAVDEIFALRVTSSPSRIDDDLPAAIFQVVRVQREGREWLVAAWKFGNADVWGIDFEALSNTDEGGTR